MVIECSFKEFFDVKALFNVKSIVCFVKALFDVKAFLNVKPSVQFPALISLIYET